MQLIGHIHTMPNLRGLRAHILVSRASLGLALLFAIIVAHESLTPVTAMPSITHFDKIMHFIAYATLGGAFTLGLPRMKPRLVCLAVIGFGAIIEILQHVMSTGRTGSLLDGLANTGGAVIGTALAVYIAGNWFLERN